jgi:hypothetical protein
VEEFVFLLILSEVDDVGPTLFVLCLKVLKEFIEAFVFLTHSSDTLVQTFSFFTFICLNKILKFFNLLNSPWPSNVSVNTTFLFLILEEEHLVLLVFVQIRVIDYQVGSLTCYGATESKRRQLHHFLRDAVCFKDASI